MTIVIFLLLRTEQLRQYPEQYKNEYADDRNVAPGLACDIA